MSVAAASGPRLVEEIDSGSFADQERFRLVREAFRPVVVRGAFGDWPVVRASGTSSAALRAYLARFATAAPAEAFVGDPAIAGRYAYSEGLDGFNFDRIRIDLLGALDRILATEPDAPTLYIGSLECAIHLPGFESENRVAALDPTVGARIWIGNRSDVSCHSDTFDNIAGVVAGRRRFTLYPPEAIADLYVGPVDFTMAGRPVGLAAGSDPGDPRYERFERWRGRALVADLGPGDALYLPKLWWHRVEATERFNVLVNYWWDSFADGLDPPDTTMMLAMTAIAERPPAERAAWRAYFDHYVFRPEGHPLAHLPPERHGILASVRSNYGRIRAGVMQRLRGG